MDLILTRFRPDSGLKRVISGPNRVQIRSRRRDSERVGCGGVGPAGGGPVAPWKVPIVVFDGAVFMCPVPADIRLSCSPASPSCPGCPSHETLPCENWPPLTKLGKRGRGVLSHRLHCFLCHAVEETWALTLNALSRAVENLFFDPKALFS